MNIAEFTSREIPLDEFPAWSPWPKRLLGLDNWSIPDRTVEKIDAEYDKDKYLELLTIAKQKENVTADDMMAIEFQLETRESFCISSRGKLYEAPAEHMIPSNDAVLTEALSPLMENVDTVVELGCGYGYNLSVLHRNFPDKTYIGGDYSANAVKLSEILYKDHDNISLQVFNFYDATYPILEACAGKKVLLFTRHAIEQLPTAAPFVNALPQYFDRIVVGANLEVVFENYTDTLLDLLRKQYVIANDYNRDLLSQLKAHKDISIEQNDIDVIGPSPLNPTSVIHWRPRR